MGKGVEEGGRDERLHQKRLWTTAGRLGAVRSHTHLRLLSMLMVQPQAGRPKMSSEPLKPPTGESRRYAILEMALTQPGLRSWQAIGYAGRDINTRLPYC